MRKALSPWVRASTSKACPAYKWSHQSSSMFSVRVGLEILALMPERKRLDQGMLIAAVLLDMLVRHWRIHNSAPFTE